MMAMMSAQGGGDMMGGPPTSGEPFGTEDGTARVTEMVDEAELE